MNTGNGKNNPQTDGAARGGHSAAGPVRGYIKLSNAAKAFNFDFKDKVVLDIGSSTGGFTQYALDQGAKKVIAVEKGTNQMKSPLRDNHRVELHEKTDIFDVVAGVADNAFSENISRFSSPETYIPDGPDRFVSEGDGSARVPVYDVEGEKVRSQKGMSVRTPAIDVILADVSFLSLTKILKYAKMNLSRSNTDFLVMFKPQFEAKPYQLNNGIVKNEKIRRQIIKNFETWLKSNNFVILNKHDNEQKGKHGNKERFYHLHLAK